MESSNDLKRRFLDWLKHPRLRTLIPLLGAFLLVVLLVILHDAFSDLIQTIYVNVLKPFFVKTVPSWLGTNMLVGGWIFFLLILISVAALMLSVISLILFQRERAISSANLEVLTRTVRGLERSLQTTLETIQELASDLSLEQRETIAKLLLRNLLEEISKLYRGNSSRSGILVRSREDKDYLWWYVTDDLTIGTMVEKYYIGDFDVEKRSVAGAAWKLCLPQRCHVNTSTGDGDHVAYVKSLSFQPGEYKYSSFMMVPLCDSFLLGGRSDAPSDEPHPGTACLGVLCLDSSRTATFDHDALFSTNPKSDAFAMPYLRAMFRVLDWVERPNLRSEM